MGTADVLTRVLDRFEVPTLASRLPSGFRDRYGLVTPQQYGIACRDVRQIGADLRIIARPL